MKVTFLGTGTSQGVPVIACRCHVCTSTDEHDKRLRTSILVEDDDTTVVIDSGPDFRQQLLRADVLKLDGLIFTHEHKDHIAGMDDIRAFNYVNQKAVDIYATKDVQKALKREFHYAFEDFKYPGVPELNLHTITSERFKVGTIEFIPVPVMHYRLEVFGYRIGDFSYVTDAKSISDESMDLLRNSKVLVINALRREQHVSHFTLEEALEVIEELKPGKAYLIHLSHQMGRHAELAAELPVNVECAYDGLELYF